LVSIKGNVGIVGIVGVEADAARIAKEPWIVSQSLAIVRLYDPVHFSSPHLLNAFLTAPWVREKLESMSGGSTVRTLPISALRGLIVPVPSADESAQAQQALDRIDMLREKIAEILQDKASQQDALWHQLWHIDPEIGED
jgi:restriction endonuclease S subunit